MNTRTKPLKPTRKGIVWVLLVAGLFSSCEYLMRKDAVKEVRLPPLFTTGRIRIAMTLREAALTFPERQPEWVKPRTMGFQFTQTEYELSKRTGMFPIPQGTFVDEKLVLVMSLVAYRGKTLKPEEISQMHGAMLKECETLYGVEHEPPVVHKSETTGNEYSQIIWNRADYRAILSLPRIERQMPLQKIAALELIAAEKKDTPVTRGLDVVRVLFDVMRGKHE